MDSTSSPKRELSDAEVKRLTGVGPKATLVVVGADFYQRDGSTWVRLMSEVQFAVVNNTLESAAQASGLRGAPPPGVGRRGDDVSAAREAK